MGILNQARASVIQRGYEYYKDKKVINFRKESDTVFYGSVKGATTYDVKIDINHTVKNTYCNCPFAKDNRKICKHMVALYFTAFPNEAEQYIENIAEQERIEEERFKEMYGYLYNEVYDEDFEYYEDDEEINDYVMYEIVSSFVNNLTLPELRFRLIEALIKLYGKDFPNIFSSI